MNIFNNILQPTLYSFAVSGNALTLAAFYNAQHMRKYQNTLIASLALCDLLVGLCGLLVYFIFSGRILNYVSTSRPLDVHMATIFEVFPTLSSAFHLVCLSIERSIAIFWPFLYNAIISRTFIRLLAITPWILSAVNAAVAVGCGIDTNATYVTTLAYVMYFIILISLTAMSIKMMMIIKTKSQVVPGQFVQPRDRFSISKGSKRITLLLLCYIISYTPMCVVSFMFVDPIKYRYAIMNIMPLLRNLMISNSCLNILVYVIGFKKYRSAYVQLLKHIRDKACPNSDT